MESGPVWLVVVIDGPASSWSSRSRGNFDFQEPSQMRVLPITLVGAAVAAAACSTGPPAPSGALGFRLPDPAAATYVSGDSLDVSVDSPLGALTLSMRSEMTLALAFAQAPEGVEVTGTVEDFAASLENPLTGTTSVDESGVSGLLVFLVDPRGEATVSALPVVDGGVEQLRPFLSLPHEIFPRLPGRPVETGASWVDTVAWSGSGDGGDFESRTVFTYTLAGDTVVAGATLLRIAVQGDVTLEGSTGAQGASLQQQLIGTTTGTYLWNPVGGLVHEVQLYRSLEGTVRLSSTNMPDMPVRASGSLRTRLVP